jgi:hypothetical protein
MWIGVADDREAVWALVAEVADVVEAELDVLVASIEDRVVARMQAANGQLSPAFHEALRKGVSAGIRDALARLRSQAELPKELLPDLIELARLCADRDCELAGLPDTWLEAEEVFWDRFQVVAERTLADTALCWDVIKAARVRLRGHPARVSGLFGRASEREVARVTGSDEDSRLRAVLRALDGQWVDPRELGYDLAGHHVAVVADASPSLEAVAYRTKRELLRVQAPGGGIWGWLGGRTRISDGDLDALIASRTGAAKQLGKSKTPRIASSCSESRSCFAMNASASHRAALPRWHPEADRLRRKRAPLVDRPAGASDLASVLAGCAHQLLSGRSG